MERWRPLSLLTAAWLSAVSSHGGSLSRKSPKMCLARIASGMLFKTSCAACILSAACQHGGSATSCPRARSSATKK